MAVNYFCSGLPVASEAALVSPASMFRFAENFMLAVYDSEHDLGLWLHLGTCPDDFGLWEDQVLIAMPGVEGFLWSTSYSRTPAARRPAGANLAFRCVEPFRRWQVSADGVGVQSPWEEALTGRVRDGGKVLYQIELDTEAVAPAWDNHASAKAGPGRGSMEDQAWAKEHYQQLFRVRGRVTIGGRAIDVDAFGVRDHSRGQRGHGYHKFGGHNLWTASFPKIGRAH